MTRAPFATAPVEGSLPHLVDPPIVEQDARCARCGEKVNGDLWGRDVWDRVVHWECVVLPRTRALPGRRRE